jgi:hypothetical protein
MNVCAFSPDRAYRYSLLYDMHPFVSSPKRTLMVVGLNPSTADEQQLDPTLRRCAGFALSWSFQRVLMANLFALRATDPRVMLAAADPVGPENTEHLLRGAAQADMVLAAWGTHGHYLQRGDLVTALLRQEVGSEKLFCLGRTKHGYPRHPLYVSGSMQPESF